MDQDVNKNNTGGVWFFGVIIFACLSLTISNAAAQTAPPLERTVTISFQNEKPDVVLSRLSQEAKFVFSYNPAVVEDHATITGSFTDKSIREILNTVFSGSIQYKERGNYIILTKAPAPPPRTSAERPLILSGYVLNGESGEKLSEVSIYDKRTLSAVVTDEFGFFKLKIDKPAEENYIAVNKKRFTDTVLTVGKGNEQFLAISLRPEVIVPQIARVEKESIPAPDTTSSREPIEVVPEKKAPIKERQVNMENIRDTLYRDFQVSFVPFVGTNSTLSGNVISDYSFNILGGYSMGTRKLELGGIFNIDRGNVSGLQLAGVFNAVGGRMHGVQLAGTVNLNRRKVDGVQLAGNVNINLSGIRGPQFAGLLNINCGAGEGAQFGGVGNIQAQDYRGSQFGGVFNVATRELKGAQVAGVLNFGKHVKGSQIGLINIADSVEGVPIGFISFVRSGYHKIELSADEIFYANIAFRTGVHSFYNIFTAGIKPDNLEEHVWSVGYGVGTAPRITRWLYLNFDLTANQISNGHFTQAVNILNKLYLGVDIQLARKFSITAGATLNGYLTRRDEEYSPLFTNYTPSLLYDDDIGRKSHLQMWWGGKVGIRFL